jgi:hypothetical protein
MAFINRERTQYQECAIWVGCSFQGAVGQVCLPIWVRQRLHPSAWLDNGVWQEVGADLSEYRPLNPRMPPLGPGAKMKGYVCAHGDRC